MQRERRRGRERSNISTKNNVFEGCGVASGFPCTPASARQLFLGTPGFFNIISSFRPVTLGSYGSVPVQHSSVKVYGLWFVGCPSFQACFYEASVVSVPVMGNLCRSRVPFTLMLRSRAQPLTYTCHPCFVRSTLRVAMRCFGLQ